MREQPTSVLAVVYANNLAAVAAFYERALQLEPVEVEATHVLLRGHSAEVAVIQAREGVSVSVAIDSPPTLRTGTPVKLSFLVEGFLGWDRNGFWLLLKRLEQDRFIWPSAEAVPALTVEQLHWLLEGIDIGVVQRHPERLYERVS